MCNSVTVKSIAMAFTVAATVVALAYMRTFCSPALVAKAYAVIRIVIEFTDITTTVNMCIHLVKPVIATRHAFNSIMASFG